MSKEIKAITLAQIALSTNQVAALTAPTPAQYVRTKPGRGGKKVSYVEGGYVTNQLNKVFGPMNWSFKVTERGETQRKNENNAEGEVWVYGELTIHDHKRGYNVAKGQYGQHPIHLKVPYGDALKAAETDALKKCASLFGIALDVYWNLLDTSVQEPAAQVPQTPQPVSATSTKPKQLSVFERSKLWVEQTTDRTQLSNALQRVDGTPELTLAEKIQLKRKLNEKIGIKN